MSIAAIQKRNSLVLTNQYFGTPPEYFDLFLDSCARNADVDFVFITDFRDETMISPQNVRFVHMSFAQFRTFVAGYFDFEISLESPYKICDFRPAFGEVLADYFSGYRYWGHCDFDMIFGQLGSVLEMLVGDRFDKLYRRGHLTIYRNSPEVNAFYRSPMAGGRYREVFATPAFCIFDETNGIDALFRKAGLRVHHDEIIFDVKPNSAYLRKTSSISGFGQYCVIGNEGLSARRVLGRKEQAFVYVHLQKRTPSIAGTRSTDSLLYLDQFGFKWVPAESLPLTIWRSLLPNLGHLWQRMHKALKKKYPRRMTKKVPI